MAITGSWKTRASVSNEYTGALKWGTGINPIHAQRDPQHHPTATREPLGSTQPSGPVPEEIEGPVQWGYCYEDSQYYIGEDYRYLEEDHPNWGENEYGRADRASVNPDFPSWGDYGGTPGGEHTRSVSHGSEVENARAIAVPTRGSTGGWLNKARQEMNAAHVSDERQYVVATSLVQGPGMQMSDNSRAQARGTDAARSGIRSRTAGMKEKDYAKSRGMGGGEGTPDMYPYQQSELKRPFFYRSAGVPPGEPHARNGMEGRTPLQRTVPADPYPGEYVASEMDYGYTDGDYYG